VTITVYFTDNDRFIQGAPPYETPVTRTIQVPASFPEAVLDAFFLGPNADEQSRGLRLVASGFTGYRLLLIDEDGVAHLYLTGECASTGAAYTIASPLVANLTQFPEIRWVKIYDENGNTGNPDGEGNSIPACLEP
jgi:hypothetical protein